MQHQPLVRALPLLLSVLCFTACAGQPVTVPTTHLPIPANLLSCTDEPNLPDPIADDTQLANWILDLSNAGADCRSKLGSVRSIVGPKPTLSQKIKSSTDKAITGTKSEWDALTAHVARP
jgi:hypothetical protein